MLFKHVQKTGGRTLWRAPAVVTYVPGAVAAALLVIAKSMLRDFLQRKI